MSSEAPAAIPATLIIPLGANPRPLALSALFPNPAPLEVDIGCGKGRFLIAWAKAHPGVNFLGIDRMAGRMAKLEKRAIRNQLFNIRLIHAEAAEAIGSLLPAESVSTFYLFFPDPWPKRRHHRRRLCTPAFLDSLHAMLQSGGQVHTATDHLEYAAQIRKLVEADTRFAEVPPLIPTPEFQTDFEIIFLKKASQIGRFSFRKVPHSVAVGGDRDKARSADSTLSHK
jgi:tRNA (guanine-N7-)-methyltransferase